MGFTKRGADLVMLYKPCKTNAKVFAIEISSADVVVWSVSSSTGSPDNQFTVGVTPDGFTELVPLATNLAGKHLRAHVATSELDSDDEGFDYDSVRSEKVLVPRRGQKAEAEFLSSDTCG